MESGQKTVLIIIGAILVIIVFLVLLVFSSAAQNDEQDSNDDINTLDPYYDNGGYYLTIPAKSIITIKVLKNIPLGGSTSNFQNYYSTIIANSPYIMTSNSTTTLYSKVPLIITYLNGLGTVQFSVSTSPTGSNYISLSSQGFLTANDVTFDPNTDVTIGYVLKFDSSYISDQETSGTITYTL